MDSHMLDSLRAGPSKSPFGEQGLLCPEAQNLSDVN